jgi:endogenous inhibitor of DNA gyrase (YacG/DUF329 family)
LSAQRKIPCPRCGAPAPFSPSNRWRPFCSERCKLIDLGEWIDERHRIPGEEADETGTDIRD